MPLPWERGHARTFKIILASRAHLPYQKNSDAGFVC
jgi:hypothetical protein